MIERFRLWLYGWLAIPALDQIYTERLNEMNRKIGELSAEVARLKVEHYIPPKTEDPKPKVIQTRTMREFNAILEQEMEHQDAV